MCYYAGHGTEVEDIKGTESSGFNQAICTSDGDVILDTEINKKIVRPLQNVGSSTLFVFLEVAIFVSTPRSCAIYLLINMVKAAGSGAERFN